MAQRCQILCVLLSIFSVLEALECQILLIIGSWGRQVGIWASRGRFESPTPGESLLFGHHCGTFFGHFWDLFLRYFLRRRLDHVFDDFGMVFVTFLTQKASLHRIMKNLIFAAIYCTSGMSQIPKTTLFLSIFTCFFCQGTVLGPAFLRFW